VSATEAAYDYGASFPKYCSHSSGTPFLVFNIFTAAVVKGIASMSKSFGACSSKRRGTLTLISKPKKKKVIGVHLVTIDIKASNKR